MLALWMGTSAACRGRGFEIESRKLKNQQRSSALFLNVSRRSPSCTSRIYIWKKNCSVVIAAFLRVNPVDSFSRGGCSERKYMCTQTHTHSEKSYKRLKFDFTSIRSPPAPTVVHVQKRSPCSVGFF